MIYEKGWTITESQFDPAESSQHHLETVFTLGNGHFGTRGTFEEGYPGAWPATLVSGVYDNVALAYTELANCPDWLSLFITIGREYVGLARGQVLNYRRRLDLRTGLLSREVRWRSPQGKTVDLCFERFVSFADDRVGAIRLLITPVDFEGRIEILAGINGYPDNQGVKHWEWLDQGTGDSDSRGTSENVVWLHLRTHHSRIELGMAARLTVRDHASGNELPVRAFVAPGYPTLTSLIDARPGHTVAVEKVVSIVAAHAADARAPVQAALDTIAMSSDYATLRQAHASAWEKAWQACDVIIEGDPKAQLAVRYNVFQVLQAASRHDATVSIPAKTLSGFAYRGHVFWDTEVFIVPFFTFMQPEIARNLLTYRHHTLAGARRKAAKAGYQGAMFAWESAATGDEVTPRWLPDAEGKELVRIWCGEIEHHITADVAHAVWQYWRSTGDDEWMCRYGAEIVLDAAVFWGSRAEWNNDRGRYEIRNVIGPDEYHEHVDNNAFTNAMAQWNLESALSVLEWLRQRRPDVSDRLSKQLDLSERRVATWRDIVTRLWIPICAQTGLIEQADGFFALEDINLKAYEPRHRSMQAILGIEGANKRQVIKQADVLMLLYLLRNRFIRDTLQRNWDYYNPRTDHTYGSSLSPAIHAIIACELGESGEAYEHFMRAALVDLEDVRGNAGEGIHGASAGGIWQAVVFGFGGVRMTDTGPIATPSLPPVWTRLKFKMQWHGRWYDFDFHARDEQGYVDVRRAADARKVASAPAPVSELCAVIFDLDGVLTDTAEYHYLGWKRLADEEGIAFDRQANEQLRGLARRESLLLLLGERAATDEEIKEMMERKNRYYLEFIERITPADLLPGASEFLDEVRAAGLKIAIGSASKNARTVVERLAIADRIDAIADGFSVTRSKPAPDLFLHAAELLGVPSSQCLVVEDADSGVQAARAAGMWTVGLGPAERFRDAHLVLPDLRRVRWADLVTRLARAQPAGWAEGGALASRRGEPYGDGDGNPERASR